MQTYVKTFSYFSQGYRKFKVTCKNKTAKSEKHSYHLNISIEIMSILLTFHQFFHNTSHYRIFL